MRKEVLGRSYIGAIATNRQGNGERNTLAGADARFTFFEHLNVMGLFARADDTRVGRSQWASQLGAEWRDDFVELGANVIDVDPEFNAGIGFVRVRERLSGVRGVLKPRPGRWGVRQFALAGASVWYSDDRGVTGSRETSATFGTTFQSGDRIDIIPVDSYERVVRRFPIGSGVTVPVGEYHWNGVVVNASTYNGRRVSGGASLSIGDFYDGTRRTLSINADVRPGRMFSFAPSYSVNDVAIRAGAFVTRLFGVRANLSFSTNLLTSAYVQYNSAGQLAATQVRLNYIFHAIDNLYVVFNDTHFTEGVFKGCSNRSLVTKITYSLHR